MPETSGLDWMHGVDIMDRVSKAALTAAFGVTRCGGRKTGTGERREQTRGRLIATSSLRGTAEWNFTTYTVRRCFEKRGTRRSNQGQHVSHCCRSHREVAIVVVCGQIAVGPLGSSSD